MTRRLDDALAAAAERGVLTSAERWHGYGRQHGEQAAVEWVDRLTGTGQPAGCSVNAGRSGYGVAARPAARMSDDLSLFAANGLLAELSRDKPALVAAAKAEDPNPPALFGDEDLPPFTASGLDPRELAALPWPLRRPVAQAPTLAIAFALVQRYAGVPEMTKTDLELARSNADYIDAFRSWLIGSGRTPASRRAPARPLRAPTARRRTPWSSSTLSCSPARPTTAPNGPGRAAPRTHCQPPMPGSSVKVTPGRVRPASMTGLGEPRSARGSFLLFRPA